MDEFAPPTGPPPPKAPEVPEGWVVRWNEQYKEWFYVNVHTKQSQWVKPTAPAYPEGEGPPSGPPPGYLPGDGPAPTDVKKNPYDDPVNRGPGGTSAQEDEDARLAAQLQAEEDARARGSSGFQSGGSYPSPSPSQNSYPNELPPRERGKSGGGFLGKLLGKGKQLASSHGGGSHGGGGYGSQQGGYPPQQQYYGQQQGYPGQGAPGGYYNQQPQYGQPQYAGGHGGGFGGFGGHGGQGGYGQQGYYGGQQHGQKKSGGLGMAGGAALGVGAGLIGGALIADAIDDHEEHEAYQEGYEDGGGGDDFGGDF